VHKALRAETEAFQPAAKGSCASQQLHYFMSRNISKLLSRLAMATAFRTLCILIYFKYEGGVYWCWTH